MGRLKGPVSLIHKIFSKEILMHYLNLTKFYCISHFVVKTWLLMCKFEY